MIKDYFRYFRQLLLRVLVVVLGKKFYVTKKRALIIAPHPDDETFGCAGLIRKKVIAGSKVDVLFLTNGEKSLSTVSKEEISQYRKLDAEKAASFLGVHKTYFLELEDGGIPRRGSDKYTESLSQFTQIINELNPEEVYVTHPLDNWSDHTGASELTFDVLNEMGNNIALYYYWVWVWFSLPFGKVKKINFKNIYCLPIEDVFTHKKKAINIYLNSVSQYGQPYCGELPKMFLKAFDWPYEVVEKKL